MKKLLLLAVILFYSFQSFAQSGPITKKKFHQGKFHAQDTSVGYAEAVLVDNVLYISGAVSKGTISEQLHGIYSFLQKTLEAYGASFQNVVKETLFTTDMNAVKANAAVRNSFYNGDFPAASWVQVSRLYSARPDAQIEVELIAHLPKKRK